MDAIPGSYAADGVWGKATLEMRRDGSFTETYHFKNQYNGKDEGGGSVEGHWHNQGRDWLTRDVELEGFTPLAEYDRGQRETQRPGTVVGYGGFTHIDVDLGADIAFMK